MSKTIRLILIFIAAIGLSGCFLAYKPPVQQGNIITTADANKIKRGMTPGQVVRRLGSPVLKNIFRESRMVYVYTMKGRGEPYIERRLFIYFKNNQVTGSKREFIS